MPQPRRAPEPQAPAHRGPVVHRLADYHVISCEACGFRHVTPLPEAEALEATYAEAYYGTTKPTYLSHASEDEAWAALGCDDRLDLMAAYLPATARRLIDVGSGPGLFLARAVARGWQAEGVEPSRQAAAFAKARGLRVIEAFFTDTVAAGLAEADAIHLMNVIEHVPDPAGLLARALARLRRGGVLCVGAPNDFNPLQRLLWEGRGHAPWWIAPPHHLNYFDFASLEGLLRRLGATPRARLTSFPMELFVALGQNYVGDEALGRHCHQRRKAFDQDLEAVDGARRGLYRALAEAGIGREAIVIATRD